MKSRDLENLLVNLSGWSQSEVDQRLRPLRKIDVLPTLSGPHAPHLTATQAAAAILQMTARRSVDSLEVGGRAMGLPMAPVGALTDVLKSASLLQFVAAFLGPVGTVRLQSLEVDCSGGSALATLIGESGSPFRAYFTDDHGVLRLLTDHPEHLDTIGGASIGQKLIVSGGFLEQVRIELAEGDETGEFLGR